MFISLLTFKSPSYRNKHIIACIVNKKIGQGPFGDGDRLYSTFGLAYILLRFVTIHGKTEMAEPNKVKLKIYSNV